MGFLEDFVDGYKGTTDILNEKLSSLYQDYKDWGITNKESFPSSLNTLSDFMTKV